MYPRSPFQTSSVYIEMFGVATNVKNVKTIIRNNYPTLPLFHCDTTANHVISMGWSWQRSFWKFLFPGSFLVTFFYTCSQAFLLIKITGDYRSLNYRPMFHYWVYNQVRYMELALMCVHPLHGLCDKHPPAETLYNPTLIPLFRYDDESPKLVNSPLRGILW